MLLAGVMMIWTRTAADVLRFVFIAIALIAMWVMTDGYGDWAFPLALIIVSVPILAIWVWQRGQPRQPN
jgi:hypothetical protein